MEARVKANQVRNSNAWGLAAQVRSAGGIPKILPIAPDRPEPTLRLMKQGLESDLLLLSGGVSAGKYDYVEPVLAELGATFLFDRVLIQPDSRWCSDWRRESRSSGCRAIRHRQWRASRCSHGRRWSYWRAGNGAVTDASRETNCSVHA